MVNLPEETPPFRKHFFPLFFLLLSIALIYYNSLNGEFIFDDEHIEVRTNLHITKLDFESLKGTFYLTPKQKKIYRPLSCLTLGLNYYFGGENPFGYHVVNVVIHILCSFSVYVFLLTLLSIPGIRPGFTAKYRYELTVVTTFLFALHPLQVNVASYIIQRMASLAALFYIISVTGYIHFRLGTLRKKKQAAVKTYFSLSIFVIGGLFAVLSKQNAAFLPMIILILDYLFFYPLSNENDQRKIRRVYAAVIFLLLCALAYAGPKYYFKFSKLYQIRDFTPTERLLTETRIIFFYLYLILLPNQNLLNLNHDFSLSKSLISPPQTFLSIIGIILLLFLFIKMRKRYNLFSFVIAWYLGNLIIESTIIPLELAYEHRTYLSGVLIYFLIAFTIIYISKRLNKNYIMVVFTSLLLIIYSQGTYLRNIVFSNETSLWLDVIEKSPKLARGYSNLGQAYWEDGYPMKSKSAYEKALELNSDMVETILNLSLIYLNTYKDSDTAVNLAKKALQIKPRDSDAPKILADIYMRKKKYKKAEHFYILSLQRRFFHSDARNGLGVAKIHLGKIDEAIQIFQNGIRMDPSYENFYLNLAKLYANKNSIAKAIRILEIYLSNYNDSRKAQILLSKCKAKDQYDQIESDEK